MKFMRSSLAFSLALACSGIANSALACSPAHINTPQELIALADGIYRVKPVAYGLPKPSSRIFPWPDTQVRLKVLATIKGTPQSELQVPGDLGRENDPNDHPVPYEFVRPGGRSGNCYAVTYRKASQYLLFVKDGSPYWSPLAPTTEQVSGPMDPWVIWVMEQLTAPAERPNNSFKPNPHRGGA
jgi:hypothetical protein